MREDSSRQPVNGMRKPINRLDQWLQSTNEATINDRNNKLTDLEWMEGLVPHCWKDGEVVSCLVGCNQVALRFSSTDGGAWFSLSEQSTGGSETAEAAAAAALAWRQVFMAAFRLLDSNGL